MVRKMALFATLLMSFPLLLHSEDKSEPKKEDAKLTAAWKELEGSWQRVALIMDGQVMEVKGGMIVVISRDGVATWKDGKKVRDSSETRYQIDPTQSPAHIDIVETPKGSLLPPTIHKGVYDIKGDTFRYVLMRDGKERPKKVENPLDTPGRPTICEYKRVEHPEKKK
jgi:uncharacterized protein (TIGR03067 family)